MLPEIAVILSLAPNSVEPVTIESVIGQAEADAQYYFYVATDVEYGLDAGKSALVRGNDYQILFEVYVQFEESDLEFELRTIENYPMDNTVRYPNVAPSIENKKASEILEFYQTDQMLLTVDYGTNWVSWIDISQFPSDELARISIQKLIATDNRVLSIRALAQNNDSVRLKALFDYFQTLDDTYSDMPSNYFEGAIRE